MMTTITTSLKRSSAIAPHRVTTIKALLIAFALATIDQDPDPLHREMTPSVGRLIDYGEPVILHVLPLMLAEDRDKRLRAQTVLEGITKKQFGFDVAQGWPSLEAERKWEQFWSDLGNLSYKASDEARKQSIELWKRRYTERN